MPGCGLLAEPVGSEFAKRLTHCQKSSLKFRRGNDVDVSGLRVGDFSDHAAKGPP